MTEGKAGTRLKVLAVLCTFMFAALGTRLWFVQVLAHEEKQGEAILQSTRKVMTPAPRGRILDRTGKVLARNRTSLIVTVNRQELPDDPTEQLDEIDRLAAELQLPLKELKKRIDTNRYYAYTPVPVAFDVPKTTFFYLGEHQSDFPGVSVVEDSIREYLDGPLAAHVLGYIGPFSETEQKNPQFAKYDPNDIVGKSGAELSFEQYLQGTKGVRAYLVDSGGRNLGPVPDASTPPVPGDDVYLTIDAAIQQLAAESLEKGVKAAKSFGLPANAGAVVVMDPNDGSIVAMASNPTFDPNIFATGDNDAIARLFAPAQPGNPCNSTGCASLNRAIQAEYPPGSTFKPFIGLTALREGVLTSRDANTDCPAAWQVPTDPDADPKANWEPVNHGYISLARALVISCDTVFYQLGFRDWLRWHRAGEHDDDVLFQNYLGTFGFGHSTGLDIPNEKPGLIPTPSWKESHNADSPDPYARLWLPGDEINMSIGQGDVRVTPLQLATAFSALANGGTVYRPHLLEKVESADGKDVLEEKRHVNGHLPFKKKDMDYVRQALTGVVGPEGTASSAFSGFPLGSIPVAGKTGTAEVNPFEPYSWFAAMAPANDPQYVVVALVEQGGHGSQSAAPVVRRILDGLFGLPLTDPTTKNDAVD